MITLYTANINGYEAPSRHNLTNDIEFLNLDIPVSGLADIELNRYYKILPHLSLKTNDIVVYADANMTLMYPNELIKLCEMLQVSDKSAILFKHPSRSTVYQEIIECGRQGRDNLSTMIAQYNAFRRKGFDDKTGLTENNVIIRKINDQHLQLCELYWWDTFRTGSKRDQVTLPYARWATKYTNFILLEQAVKEHIFKWRPHQC